MPSPQPYHAAVTGDIVQSTRLAREQFREVQDAITNAGAELARHFPQRMPLPVELSRGDSWQIFVLDPADSLRMALYMRAFIRAQTGVDTRISIGVGSVDKMPEKSVGDGRGEAFRLSGDMAEKKRAPRMRFAMEPDDTPEDGGGMSRAISTILTVLDVVVARWTSAQATAVRGALLGWKQEEIAEKWPAKPITQQSAWQHLDRAGWDGVETAIDYYESVMKKWSPR